MERITEEEISKWIDMKNMDAYYDENFMPIILERIKEKEHKLQDLKNIEKIDYMIMTVGGSYNPLIISLKYFVPKEVVLFYTDQVENSKNKVLKFANKLNINCILFKVTSTDTLTIYDEIKNMYIKWNKPENIIVDFTGGTKPMSIAVAMACYILGGSFIYLETETIKSVNRPKPDTEILNVIPNPYKVFGDLEIKKAFDLFEQFDYTNAFETLNRVYDALKNGEEKHYIIAKILKDLSLSYKYWDELDFKKAFENMKSVCTNLKEKSILFYAILKIS